MLPFRVDLQPGRPVQHQLVYAVRKAIVSGVLKPGGAFPSVRQLSRELRINPNTAHKAVALLVAEGLLAVKPGVGTVVAATPRADRAARRTLLQDRLERVVVEARRLGLEVDEVVEALERHWERLGGEHASTTVRE